LLIANACHRGNTWTPNAWVKQTLLYRGEIMETIPMTGGMKYMARNK
jgi:hypothetical protein